MPVRKPSKFGSNVRFAKDSSRRQRTKTITASSLRATEGTSQDEKIQATRLANSIDEAMGFGKYESGKRRVGWLYNMHSTSIEDSKIPGGRAGVDFYFIGEEGDNFKATVEYDPYFLLAVKRGKEPEVEEWCKRLFEGLIKTVNRLTKEDLQMPNHLLGYRRTFLQLTFANVSDLLSVRKVIMPIAEQNKEKVNAMDTYAEVASATAGFDVYDEEQAHDTRPNGIAEASDFIVDIREYDVPYHVRLVIDKDIRIGKWYTVEAKHGSVTLSCLEERLQRADPVVLAFDIETTKLPLKFPDATIDQIMMISYMIDGQGFLITNREIVSEDISDFDYTPKAEYEGPFLVFNELNERSLVERFFSMIKEARPTVIATYNGDFFDWPFVEARASVNGIDMYAEIGFRKNSEDIYQSDYCVHMDCFAWVNRDSYLPQGSRGLKAVTVAKLGYDPDELDPELMTPYASEHPQILAEYSVSDAVATYYLYMKYVHPFIFSLCTIIPLSPDDTLRKGTGTLCEMLLMVQAYQKNIVLPNKHKEPREAFWEGHLLDSETYVGGHVESIEAGVFRADIPVNFAIDKTAIDELIQDLDAALKFCITVEEKKSMDDVTNYDEVRTQIIEKLNNLKETPNRNERPLIYHLDVASMYPNIMTTNRLQPDSMISESDCAACDFNRPGKTCDRRLPWAWRGEFLPTKRDEYNMIRTAVMNESFPGKFPQAPRRTFQELSLDEQAATVRKRLQDYSKKIYHKIHDSKTIEREAIICQRENPFYVNTVRDFRDRRYDFKGQQKVWKGKTEALKSSRASASEIDEAKKMIILYDSLQLAHKVILNSFYGYVMRKGSRWYSMEMAGVTCLTGAHIIQMARELVERIGRPLELDTDGIWCMLPATFPENVVFTLKNGKKMAISYPCVMLNHLVHARFTNHQYQTLVDPGTFKYETHSDNSIFFEVDGPYKAMILPTSKEEDKNLKKRYAVFNHDGTLAELKGFEVKRRGELKLIKIFQTQIFKFFLEGTTLAETYGAVARVANRWLDVLHQHGSTLADEELIDLICENKSMAKTLEEYGAQKSTSITTAKRLAEFLGDQMTKDKGLNCKYIISARPRNTPVTERAIPVAIFSADENVKRFFLRKWLKDDPADMDPRNVIDWDYYLERLGSVIQKLITIPAALQKVRNPVPRVAHPDWLQKRINAKDDKFKQKKMTDLFEKRPLVERSVNLLDHRLPATGDIEDALNAELKPRTQPFKPVKRKADDMTAKVLIDPYAELPSDAPAADENYAGWLNYQKKKWKVQKQARARRRQLFGERPNVGTDSISNFFRNQAELLFINTWHVLHFRQGDLPGEVTAFVLIGKKIHALNIKVPRTLYLNLKGDEIPNVEVPECEVEKVNHVLPNGHPSTHLFQLTMSEDTYLHEAESVALLCNHYSVEGVYERGLPLSMRAMLKLGNMCSFDESQKGVLGKGLEQGFDLSALMRSDAQSTYLEDPSWMGYVYLYHVTAGDRTVFALFSSTKTDAHIVVLSRSRDAQLPNADKLYGEQYRQKQQDDTLLSSLFDYQPSLHFKVSQVITKRKAHLEISDTLKKWRSDETKPTMLLLQTTSSKQLMHDIRITKEYPILCLPTEQGDADLPSLGWQAFIFKRLISHYFSVNGWLTHLIELARYGDVPVCNLEKDDPRFLIDLAYARRLKKNNVVLWWSDNPRPDHAGHERDDILGPLTEVVEMPSINNPSVYTSVCVDVSVQNLVINTILTSSIINDLEGSTDSVAFNPAAGEDAPANSRTARTNAGFAQAALEVLREMVKSWWAEACQGHRLADVMVQHLVRWVEAPASCLYDRHLHYYVQMMSKKAMQQLITDFRRVGSQVVFASPTRLLLQTSKQEVGNAYAYSQYILKSIQQKPLFHFLGLEIKDYWDILVWYDQYNYGGKGTSTVTEETVDSNLETVVHWQISQFLPQLLQPVFDNWVVTFINLMQHLKRPANTAGGPSATPGPTQLASGFISLTEDPTSTEVTTVLQDGFSKPLKKKITSLIRRQREELLHHELASDWSFPSLPGGSLEVLDRQHTLNPVLELVKSLMQIISLSKPLQLEARLLRKDLLALFDVKEFGRESRFENPSASLRFDSLVCDTCTMTRDLDLCRDEDVLPDPQASEEDAVNRPWRCTSCQAEYSKIDLEESLIARIQASLLSWQMQDLKCKKCSVLQGDDCVFADHCTCGGEWAGTMDRSEVSSRLKTMERVSSAYGLRMLQGVVESARTMCMIS
ncbi:DNA polymerase epsilon catalytic subunit A [Exophiala aquamarina CBS 119918]|uniref:DNA polymerase epsilon catalytic subunit n=1 Tax=Exophiala aquamarina CBS 119918 TaxID=1182545 RepID=A0A072PIP7_9EURO|nr:DNA polymerase epsilon catalytic subunit A [Exophiala aquamarina CBS 119918]KEF59736.1 DNA polymerase epsilon catalytic subunit A [Exophiala aquamarina CBS 119918]